MKIPSFVLITGASSGLGAALAREYGALGVSLFLTGRNEARLEAVAEECRAMGARVSTHRVDVTDYDAMQSLIDEIEARVPLDLIIANAGIGEDLNRDTDISEHVFKIFHTNVDGVLATVNPALAHMRSRRQGQIAIVSSLLGYFGVGSTLAYAASKNAVRAYGQGLRQFLAPENVQVSVICPGFVRTPMTDKNDFAMPFIVEPDKAARIIRRRLAQNHGQISFPWPLAWATSLGAMLPPAVRDWIMKRLG